MKYEVSIIINRPRTEVVEKFDNPDNLRHWMEGLQSFEPLEGTPGTPGARSKVVFQQGKRRIEMIEIITENSLPDRMSGTYDAPGVHNIVVNRFEELDPQTTRVVNEQEFQMKGLMMKVFALLMPAMFRKQSMKYLSAFKAFVEEGASVA